MKDLEYKTFPFEFKEVDSSSSADEGVIEGYASTFGNIDQGLDVVDQGAFKKTLKDSKGRVPILADHNPYDQIGWGEAGSEDKTGLLVSGSLMLKVQKAAERYALAKKALEIGAPAGISIGYTTIKAEPDASNTRIRRLKELKLWEYSLVTFPMNTQAMVTAAKGMGALDKAAMLLKSIRDQGISLKDLELALQIEAAKVDEDPVQLHQSIDNLIEKFRV